MNSISFAAPQADINQEDALQKARVQGWSSMAEVASHNMDVRKSNQTDWQLRLEQQKIDNERWARQQAIAQAEKAASIDQAQFAATQDFRMKDLDVRSAAQQSEAEYRNAMAQKALGSIQNVKAGQSSIKLNTPNPAGSYAGLFNLGADNVGLPTGSISMRGTESYPAGEAPAPTIDDSDTQTPAVYAAPEDDWGTPTW